MRKYNIILICVVALLSSSCDKFLDIQPVGKVIPTNVEEYRALLTKAYAAVPTDRGFVNFRSDEMVVRDDEWDKKAYDAQQKWDDNTTLEDAKTYSWQFFYQTIYIANQIVDNRGNIKLTSSTTQADVDQLVAEAYILRAYMHFILVNLHGQPYTKAGAPETKAVPLVLDTDTEAKRTRDTVGVIYQAILSDIESARKLMNKERWEASFSYRFNKASVDAFSARVNLYMGNWEQALNGAKAVIGSGYQLEDMNAEKPVIANLYNSTENIVALEYILDGSLNRAAVLANVAKEWFAKDDARFKVNFKTVDDSTDIYLSQKGGKNEFKTTFRLGEFVITAAEAATQMGNLTDAKTFLKQLVEKRYTPEGVARVEAEIANLDKDGLLNFIYLERARELAFEGHRWFDLRRTTRPEIVKEIDGQTYILKQDDPRYTIPIPRDAIRSNPNLAN